MLVMDAAIRPLERTAVRKALGRLVAQGAPSAVWLPEIQPLLALPAVHSQIERLGPNHADDALLIALREAVDRLRHPQYQELLTIVLALDERYAGLSARHRREIAGREFRGGTHAVTWGTIRQHHEPRALDLLTSVLTATAGGADDAVADQRSGTESTRCDVEWHPLVHIEWANERLSFWRLAFREYVRGPIVEDLRALLDDAGVRSWSLDELYGPWDLLLRTWVPSDVSDFRHRLERLTPHSLSMIDSFAVDEIVAHWRWPGPDGGELAAPDAAALDNRPSRGELVRVERGAAADDPLLLTLARQYLLSVAQSQPGIQFVVSVHPGRPITRAASTMLTDRISTLLRDADNLFEPRSTGAPGPSSCSLRAK